MENGAACHFYRVWNIHFSRAPASFEYISSGWTGGPCSNRYEIGRPRKEEEAGPQTGFYGAELWLIYPASGGASRQCTLCSE